MSDGWQRGAAVQLFVLETGLAWAIGNVRREESCILDGNDNG